MARKASASSRWSAVISSLSDHGVAVLVPRATLSGRGSSTPGLCGVPEVGDDRAAVRGQDEADDRRDLFVGDLAAAAREGGLDQAARVLGLEAADVLVAQAVAVQQRR